MAWHASSPMTSVWFHCGLSSQGGAVGQVCLRHGISRKTGYKWLRRYEAEGASGLGAVSSARHTQGHAVAPAVAERLIALRSTRPSWGPRKLLARLAMDDAASGAATDWPAASTVGDLLRRASLTRACPRRPAAAGSKPALVEPDAPNQSGAIDFKGWFRTGDGVRCAAVDCDRRLQPLRDHLQGDAADHGGLRAPRADCRILPPRHAARLAV